MSEVPTLLCIRVPRGAYESANTYPGNPELGKLRQEDGEFKASLDYLKIGLKIF